MEDKFSTVVDAWHAGGLYAAADIAQIFGRLITEGLLENDLPERMAVRWGTNAGHYGRLALEAQEKEAAYAMLQREGFAVIASGFGEGR